MVEVRALYTMAFIGAAGLSFNNPTGHYKIARDLADQVTERVVPPKIELKPGFFPVVCTGSKVEANVVTGLVR